MASPPVLTPSGTTGFNIETWKRTAEEATYQKMVMIPIIEDYGQRVLGLGHVRKHARVTSTVLAQSADGDTLTASNIIGTPITLTPAGNYILVSWSLNEDAQVELNLDREAVMNIEQALAEGSDQTVLTNVQALTQTMSQASVDGPMWRKAVGRLMGNTNGVAIPGGKTIYAIFSHTQYPNLGDIPEFNNAEVRGDSENPYVKGIWMKGGGAMLNFSTVVAQDANGWHNVLFVAEAFTIGWNTKTMILHQNYLAQKRVLIFNNFGSNVQHDLRAIGMRTTASGL